MLECLVYIDVVFVVFEAVFWISVLLEMVFYVVIWLVLYDAL